jgi:hypothetical protein
MNRWAVYIDIEGTSKIYESQEARFYLALDGLLTTVCHISREVFPESPARLFPHQVGGDGVVIVSEFAEGKPETPISIAVVLLQVLMVSGLVGKAGISEGTFADIKSCLPSFRSLSKFEDNSDHSTIGLLTTFPVMGTALINSHRLATCKPRGARLAVDSGMMRTAPDGVAISHRDGDLVVVDWIHTWTKVIQEIISRTGI